MMTSIGTIINNVILKIAVVVTSSASVTHIIPVSARQARGPLYCILKALPPKKRAGNGSVATNSLTLFSMNEFRYAMNLNWMGNNNPFVDSVMFREDGEVSRAQSVPIAMA